MIKLTLKELMKRSRVLWQMRDESVRTRSSSRTLTSVYRQDGHEQLNQQAGQVSAVSFRESTDDCVGEQKEVCRASRRMVCLGSSWTSAVNQQHTELQTSVVKQPVTD